MVTGAGSGSGESLSSTHSPGPNALGVQAWSRRRIDQAPGAGSHRYSSSLSRPPPVVLSREGLRFYPIVTRYAWPSELDLMARIAGLRPTDRWGGWDREPFLSKSRNHISVYGR